MSEVGLQIALLLLLIVANGVFAMAELAVASSRKIRLQRRAETGDAGAQAALEVWRKGQTRKLNVTVGELQEDRVASRETSKPKPQAEVAANRLGMVVAERTAEQKNQLKLANGLMVTEVRPDAKAEVRKGDILLTVVHKGQHIELKSVEQFNKLLAGLDKSSVITLQVRRGESTAFVTISGLTDKG